MREHKTWGDIPGGGGYLPPAPRRGTTMQFPWWTIAASHFLPTITPVSNLSKLYCYDDSKPPSSQPKYVHNQLRPIRSHSSCMLCLKYIFCSHVSLMGQYSYSFGLFFTGLKHAILVLSQFVGQSLFIWCISTCTQIRLNSRFFLLNFLKFYIWSLTRALHSASSNNIVKGNFSVFFLNCHQIGDAYSLPLYTMLQLMMKYFHC